MDVASHWHGDGECVQALASGRLGGNVIHIREIKRNQKGKGKENKKTIKNKNKKKKMW